MKQNTQPKIGGEGNGGESERGQNSMSARTEMEEKEIPPPLFFVSLFLSVAPFSSGFRFPLHTHFAASRSFVSGSMYSSPLVGP
ncbi:hypothetical protein Csa_000935 [Cucumis sativus]|uniref:Uncharacterized protein n=1 Tax=Cucumis sativus TaxID=3659 RepID=A0A0A0LDA4_CUCSA|nr:hypothetical protein Csa_000935 [Cucumis sativus]